MIFYPYDIEDYTKNEGFSFEYNEHTPGPKVLNPESLRKEVELVLKKDIHSTERKKIRDLYHDYNDPYSSGRIIQSIAKEENLSF